MCVHVQGTVPWFLLFWWRDSMLVHPHHCVLHAQLLMPRPMFHANHDALGPVSIRQVWIKIWLKAWPVWVPRGASPHIVQNSSVILMQTLGQNDRLGVWHHSIQSDCLSTNFASHCPYAWGPNAPSKGGKGTGSMPQTSN